MEQKAEAIMDSSIKIKRQEFGGELKLNKFKLPLVSVIIINYNYGRFLREAVDSVYSQNYENIECIIVDNASTDDSKNVLLDVIRDYANIITLKRPRNDGQCTACMEGFEVSSGQYVVFLDADDVLLPTFVETHVFVHLSLRIPVGFSSSDMIQTIDSRMVLGSLQTISEYVRSKKGKKVDLLRRFDKSCPELWPLRHMDDSIEDQVHLVEPMNVADWVWSPTSGNCFRRDALNLFMIDRGLRELCYAIDTYLIRAISVFMGSVVIDRSLSIYRMHGANSYSKHPHLNGMLNYDRFGPNDLEQRSREIIIDHLILHAKLFLSKVHYPEYYLRALEAINNIWPPLLSSRGDGKSYLAEKLLAESSDLAEVIGSESLRDWRRQHRCCPSTNQEEYLKLTLRRRIFSCFRRK